LRAAVDENEGESLLQQQLRVQTAFDNSPRTVRT
jgi:hypothetical protein